MINVLTKIGPQKSNPVELNSKLSLKREEGMVVTQGNHKASPLTFANQTFAQNPCNIVSSSTNPKPFSNVSKFLFHSVV